jgi:hypothetical protein
LECPEPASRCPGQAKPSPGGPGHGHLARRRRPTLTTIGPHNHSRLMESLFSLSFRLWLHSPCFSSLLLFPTGSAGRGIFVRHEPTINSLSVQCRPGPADVGPGEIDLRRTNWCRHFLETGGPRRRRAGERARRMSARFTTTGRILSSGASLLMSHVGALGEAGAR